MEAANRRMNYKYVISFLGSKQQKDWAPSKDWEDKFVLLPPTQGLTVYKEFSQNQIDFIQQLWAPLCSFQSKVRTTLSGKTGRWIDLRLGGLGGDFLTYKDCCDGAEFSTFIPQVPSAGAVLLAKDKLLMIKFYGAPEEKFISIFNEISPQIEEIYASSFVKGFAGLKIKIQ